jgi:DNA (cytosine-5)-methyltransferase 1
MVVQQSNDERIRELALFAGSGGGILGGLLLGWRTVCAVECDHYAASVLVSRQNDGILEPFPIWDDVRTFDGSRWQGRVDIVSGGFPCQDISVAGKGAGITGERSGLWKEMARIVGEVRPRFVWVENSPALLVRGIGVVVGDLAEMGYDCRWGIVSAADAGAPHIRKRIWILANSNSKESRIEFGKNSSNRRRRTGRVQQALRQADWENGSDGSIHAGYAEDMADSEIVRLQGSTNYCDGINSTKICDEKGELARSGDRVGEDISDSIVNGLEGIGERINTEGPIGLCNGKRGNKDVHLRSTTIGWWEVEPDVGRVVDGLAHRMDRLRCTGNGQVPGVVVLAWKMLEKLIEE